MLEELGMPVKILKVLQSLYQQVECCIRINGVYTDRIPVKLGRILSPSLFNLYLNGLLTRMKMRDLGVEVNGLMVTLLLYADYLAILA